MGAFRTSDGSEVLEAPTHGGILRLEVAPRHVALRLGALQVAITDEFVAVTEAKGKKVKRWSERLGGALVVARDVPHEDLAVWMELPGGGMKRVFGAAPRDLIDDDGLPALRALDRLAAQLRQVLSPYARGARRGFELGRGLDKVLVTDLDDRLVIHARRLFGAAARRVLEVHADGHVVVPGRRGDRTFQVHDRYGVTVMGDLVRFMDPTGTDLGQVVLHWIEPEDRQELARRCGDMIERNLPSSQGERRDTRAVWRKRDHLIGRLKVRQLRTGW
jgi:hypothetical protein